MHRVRLIDNSDDSSETSASGPEMLYDSSLDPVWPAPNHQPLKTVRDPNESGWVDVKGGRNRSVGVGDYDEGI